jgi:hypothetical protein
MRFTYAEYGALLVAVGTVMQEADLCAGAAMDGGNREQMLGMLEERGIEEDRAMALLEVDLQEAIEFVDESLLKPPALK